MYFELIKEVIKYILNTGYSKKNLEKLEIIKDREDITKDKLLCYMDYLFSFTTNFYKKQALKNILNNFEVYYQIQKVHTPGKEHLWKEYKHIVTIRNNLTDKYINRYKTYEDAAAKVLWLQSEDKRLDNNGVTYRILGFMCYVASDVEYSTLDGSILQKERCEVPHYVDTDYFDYEKPPIFFD